MTPTASRLKTRLDVRQRWFANEWFAKWHLIGRDGPVSIDSFDGRGIHQGGVEFAGGARDLYWETIVRGVKKEITEQFAWVDQEVRSYNRETALRAIDECAGQLMSFVRVMRRSAVAKDRILRGNGQGYPPENDAGWWEGTADKDIVSQAEELKAALPQTTRMTEPPTIGALLPPRQRAMRPSLATGVFTTAVGLAGGGAIVVFPSLLWIGYSLIGVAILLFVWGVTIDGQHWWKRQKPLTPEEVAYREEMARQKAKQDAKRQRDMEKVKACLGGNLYSVMEEVQKDQQAQAEAQRQRLIREASEPPAPATFTQAFNENVADRIPFVRLRELAPTHGLTLDPHDPGSSNLAYKIEGALRQAAVDGELKVWGRKYRDVPNNDPLVPISAGHFEEYGFAHGNLHYPTANSLTRTNTIKMATWGVEGKDGVTYRDLQLSQSGAEAVLRKLKAEED